MYSINNIIWFDIPASISHIQLMPNDIHSINTKIYTRQYTKTYTRSIRTIYQKYILKYIQIHPIYIYIYVYMGVARLSWSRGRSLGGPHYSGGKIRFQTWVATGLEFIGFVWNLWFQVKKLWIWTPGRRKHLVTVFHFGGPAFPVPNLRCSF